MENNFSPDKPDNTSLDRQIADMPKNMPGWGIDADPENDPTYPMKKRTGADYDRLNYERAPQQPETVEILQSIERPAPPRVFGTSTPPSGLSGSIRRFAFQYSESSYAHWVPLILADRIQVIEGIVDDIKKGSFPNIFAEKGWNAEWKYNKTGLLKKAAVGAALIAGIVLICKARKKSDYSEEL